MNPIMGPPLVLEGPQTAFGRAGNGVLPAPRGRREVSEGRETKSATRVSNLDPTQGADGRGI